MTDIRHTDAPDGRTGVSRRRFMQAAVAAGVGTASVRTVLGAAPASAAVAHTLSTAGLRIGFDGLTGALASLVDPTGSLEYAAGHGGFHLHDAISNNNLVALGPVTSWTVGADEITFTQSSVDGTLSVTNRVAVRADGLGFDWRVTIENLQPAVQRQLEGRLGLPVDYAARGPWRYFSGHHGTAAVTPTSNTVQVNGVWNTAAPGGFQGDSWLQLPVSAVDNGDFGMAVGIDPLTFVSYFFSGAAPLQGQRSAVFEGVDIVLDGGATVSVDFVVYGFRAHHGHRNAVDTYYRQFPTAYNPDPDLDRRYFRGSGATLWQIVVWRNMWWEECRRFKVGWLWAAVPFRRTGDFFPHAEHWPPVIPSDTFDFNRRAYEEFDVFDENGLVDIERFKAMIVAWYDTFSKTSAINNYLIPQLCERALADTVHTDSILRRYDGTPEPVAPLGTVILGEDTQLMFAYGNSFAEAIGGNDSKPGHLVEITDVYRPDGLAFDNAPANQMHFVDQPGAPGRAFLGLRVYSSTSLGYYTLMAKSRELTGRTGARATVAANTPGSLVAPLTDVALAEAVPFAVEGWDLRFRQTMGRKPTTYFTSFDTEFVKGAMSDEEYWAFVTNRLRDLLLYCFRTAAIPNNHRHVWGFPFMFEALPTLVRLSEAQWEPVPAATTNSALWLERYGRGVGTLLSVVNYNSADVTATVALDGRYLGTSLLGSAYGPSVTTRWSNGQTATQPVTVPAKSAMVVNTLATFEPAPILTKKPKKRGTLTTASPLNGTAVVTQSETSWRADVTLDAPAAVRVTGWLPEKAWAVAVRVNGTTVASSVVGGAVQFDADLSAGPGVIEVTYRPQAWRASPTADVLDFPFVHDGASDVNLLRWNVASGSENGDLTGLTPVYDSRFESSTEQAWQGERSIKAYPQTRPTPPYYFLMLNNLTLPEPGTYTLSSYVWIPSDFDGTTVDWFSYMYDGSTMVSRVVADMTKRDQWQRISYTVDIAAGDLTGQWFLHTSDLARGHIYVDGLQLEKASSPSPWAGPTKNRPNCVIVVGNGASEAERFAAERISTYFEYYNAETTTITAGLQKAKSRFAEVVPVVEAAQVGTARNVVVIGRPATNEVAASLAGELQSLPNPGHGEGVVQVLTPSNGAYDRVLYVAGTDDEATDATVVSLLDTLDERYPWYGINVYGAKPPA